VIKIGKHFELSEVFILKGVGKPMPLAHLTIQNLKILKNIVEDYTGLSFPNYWENVYGDLADYRVVDKLLCSPDVITGPALNSKYYSQKIEGGCTMNGITYILKSKFKRLSAVEQYVLLLHERAHAFDESIHSHEWINPWTQALYVLLSLKIGQDNDHFRKLEKYELRALRTLMTLGPHYPHEENYAFANSSHSRQHAFRILKNGGGLILGDTADTLNHLKLDDQSFVSVDSQLYLPLARCTAHFERTINTYFLNSKLTHGSFVECANLENTTVNDSWLQFRTKVFGVHSSDSGLANIINSEFSNGTTIEFQGYVRVEKTIVQHSFLVFDHLKSILQMDLNNIPIVDKKIDFSDFITSADGDSFDEEQVGTILSVRTLQDPCFNFHIKGKISEKRKNQAIDSATTD